jgi:hypothetical protein
MARKATAISPLVLALIEDARVALAPAILSAREEGDSHRSPQRRHRGVKRRARPRNRGL